MVTVVNTPNTEDSGSGMWFFLSIFLVAIMLLLFFYFGIPALKNLTNSRPQISVPDKIDVNINQQK